MPLVEQSTLDALVERIIEASTPGAPGTANEGITDPQLGALVTAYNALKGNKDPNNQVVQTGDNVGVYNPATNTIDWSKGPPKSTKPETTEVPGRGIVQINRPQGPTPDGTPPPPFGTTIPGTEPVVPASKTPDQIAAESGANVRQSDAATRASNATVANMESPAQRQANAIAQINAQARAQAQVQWDLLQKKLDAGIEIPKAEELSIKAKLDEIAADAASQRRQTEADYAHELNQPNREREIAATESTAASSAAQVENTRISQERDSKQRSLDSRTGALYKQGEAGQSALQTLIKAGVAPSAASMRAAESPYQYAAYLSSMAHQAILDGDLSTSPPQPPQPTQRRTAPPPVSSTRTAPAPAQDPAQPDPEDQYPRR